MRHSFDFIEHPNHPNDFHVSQVFYRGGRNIEHTMIAKVIARRIPKKFVQRYIDKLVELGYTLRTEWGFTSLESKEIVL